MRSPFFWLVVSVVSGIVAGICASFMYVPGYWVGCTTALCVTFMHLLLGVVSPLLGLGWS